jgi:hypothetical protein
MGRMLVAAVMLTGLAAALWAGGSREGDRGPELPSELAELRGPEWEERFTESLEAALASERIPPHVATLVLRRADIDALAEDPRAAARTVSRTARETDRALRRGTPAHVASALAKPGPRRSRALSDGVAGPPSQAALKGARDLLRDRTQGRTKAGIPGGPPGGHPAPGGPGPPDRSDVPDGQSPAGPPDDAGRPFP